MPRSKANEKNRKNPGNCFLLITRSLAKCVERRKTSAMPSETFVPWGPWGWNRSLSYLERLQRFLASRCDEQKGLTAFHTKHTIPSGSSRSQSWKKAFDFDLWNSRNVMILCAISRSALLKTSSLCAKPSLAFSSKTCRKLIPLFTIGAIQNARSTLSDFVALSYAQVRC